MTTQEKHSGPTCKTCGFYENNCPYIRGKFVPYPSRVCKDYTDSTMKRKIMKYIDVDKLKVEIKGLQCERGFKTGEAERAYQFAIEDILAFINSLQQEQPNVELEEEIQRYLCEECSSDDEPTIAEIAHHFYELGRKGGSK